MQRAQLFKLLLSVVILIITLAVVEYKIGWYSLLTSWQGFTPDYPGITGDTLTQ